MPVVDNFCYPRIVENNPDTLWKSIAGELEVTSKSSGNFNMYIKPTSAIGIVDNQLILGFISRFHINRFVDYYIKEARGILFRLTGGKLLDFKCEVAQKGSKDFPRVGLFATGPSSDTKELTKLRDKTITIKNKYTFTTFVVGPHNQLAHAAARACVLHPGDAYNPLFIYGGPGLGKTHLMQAIGNAILETDAQKKILYVTSERFMNEFIQSLAAAKMKDFKQNYRSVDVLLIDDVQFLSKKDSTLDEFFHTFNTLHQEGKQIIISSDRPPKALAEMPERLVSRFEGGMVVDIAPPDLETRIAILLTKCEDKKIKVEHSILEFLAQNIEDNVRTLEGMLNKVITLQAVKGRSPTIEEITGHLKEVSSSLRHRDISISKVLNTVSNFYHIPTEDILGSKRLKEYVKPRQVVMYLLKNEACMSYPIIGRDMRGKDHTTIMHGVRKIELGLKTDIALRQEINDIKEVLYH